MHVRAALYEFLHRARMLYPCQGFQFGFECNLYEAFCHDLKRCCCCSFFVFVVVVVVVEVDID